MTSGSLNCDARKRYRQSMMILGIVYVVSVVAISWIFPVSAWAEWPRRVGALIPVLPVVGMVLAMGRYLDEEPDEFYRLVQTRAMLAATGALLVFGTAWGFLQEYAGLGPFPVLIIFPIWCAAFALATVWAGRKYR